MTYNELLHINQAKAQKTVIEFFPLGTTTDQAYNIIYDLSESVFRNQSGEFKEWIENIMNKADFAKMNNEYQAIFKAWKQYEENEARFSELF